MLYYYIVVKYSKIYKELTLFNFMVKVLNPKRHNMIMEITEEAPLIVAQKRFLEGLIEGNLEKARELAQVSEEERYKRSYEYWGEEVPSSEDEEEKDLKSSHFYTYLDESGLILAWTLRNKPKESRKRVIYLCLRGLRDGILQFMSEKRIIYPEQAFKERFSDFFYFKGLEKHIQDRLARDSTIQKHFDLETSPEFFSYKCKNIARAVVKQYVNKNQEKLIV